jgi:hypothetical protein
MSGVWLKCDHCNKELRAETDQEMQLAVRFKPSLFPLVVGQLHPEEHRHRCRACGWVNIFVPSASSAADQPNSLLTPSWRHVSLKA